MEKFIATMESSITDADEVWLDEDENSIEIIESEVDVTFDRDTLEVPGPSINSPYSFLDLSEFDLKDNTEIDELYDDASGTCCSGTRCNKRIPKNFALKHRYSFMEMSKEEQDLVILSQLQAFRPVPELAQHYGEFTKRGSSRSRGEDKPLRRNIEYHFCGLPICKKMFFFLHNVGKKRFRNLLEHFDNAGISARVHKLTNKKPAHKKFLSTEDRMKIVNFIKSFADENRLPHPSGNINCNKLNVIKLPPNESKSSLHRKYLKAVEDQPDLPKLARSTFLKVWQQYCPHISHNQAGGRFV